MILGGAEEVGANCCYLNLDGTGVIIDAGLHPRDRSLRAFPDVDALEEMPTDVLFITHAHTDHIGALPYVMRRFPHLRPIMTHATRDLSQVMLQNGSKLLKSDLSARFPAGSLQFYEPQMIELLRQAFEAAPYNEPVVLRGYRGKSDVSITAHWSGHILGSASVLVQSGNFSVLHTGDIQFEDQSVVPKAMVPRHHVNVLVTEATNCATESMPSRATEAKRLATFINKITAQNGSILIPSFALGKLQEIITLLYGLMRKGSIPYLPIYSGGMGISISKIYDQYCYSDPMRTPGFEVSDVPQTFLRKRELLKGDYFDTPSIVLASSGMVSPGTMSHELSNAWMSRPNFGIAFIGYQDETTPGYQLSMSTKKVPFKFGVTMASRACEVERFRFSAHASREKIIDYIGDVRPDTLVIVHGETEACEQLAVAVREWLPGTRIIIPRSGVSYKLLADNY